MLDRYVFTSNPNLYKNEIHKEIYFHVHEQPETEPFVIVPYTCPMHFMVMFIENDDILYVNYPTK